MVSYNQLMPSTVVQTWKTKNIGAVTDFFGSRNVIYTSLQFARLWRYKASYIGHSINGRACAT